MFTILNVEHRYSIDDEKFKEKCFFLKGNKLIGSAEIKNQRIISEAFPEINNNPIYFFKRDYEKSYKNTIKIRRLKDIVFKNEPDKNGYKIVQTWKSQYEFTFMGYVQTIKHLIDDYFFVIRLHNGLEISFEIIKIDFKKKMALIMHNKNISTSKLSLVEYLVPYSAPTADDELSFNTFQPSCMSRISERDIVFVKDSNISFHFYIVTNNPYTGKNELFVYNYSFLNGFTEQHSMVINLKGRNVVGDVCLAHNFFEKEIIIGDDNEEQIYEYNMKLKKKVKKNVNILIPKRYTKNNVVMIKDVFIYPYTSKNGGIGYNYSKGICFPVNFTDKDNVREFYASEDNIFLSTKVHYLSSLNYIYSNDELSEFKLKKKELSFQEKLVSQKTKEQSDFELNFPTSKKIFNIF